MARTKVQDDRTPMQRFYDNQVRELADRQTEEARAQIEAAFANPPSTPDGVDGWFEENFHKEPVSHDTALFSQLQAMKAALRSLAGQQ